MKNKNKIILNACLIGFLILLILPLMFGRTYSRTVQAGYPGTSADYLARQGITLSPTWADSGSCGVGQDFVLQVSPTGCDPKVIRSDLLEEQNVPVFCPIVATKINPLVDIDAIESMSFAGDYPREVSGVGFHPAQAALSSGFTLINSPILENVGYAVIVLRKNVNESSMPDYVEGNLTATVRYDIQNVFGIGRAEFYLQELMASDWNSRYKEFSFWNGNGFLRAENIDSNGADIVLYKDKENKVTSFRLEKGETSRKVYVSGYYCMAELQVKLHDVDAPDIKAKLKVDSEYVQVGDNEKFLENKCWVVDLKKRGLVQSVKIRCREDEGVKESVLSLSPRLKFGNDVRSVGEKVGEYYIAYIDTTGDRSKSSSLVVWMVNNVDKKYLESEDKLNERGLEKYYDFIKKKLKKNPDYSHEMGNSILEVVYGGSISDEEFLGYAGAGERKVCKVSGKSSKLKIRPSNLSTSFCEPYKKSTEAYLELVKKHPSVRQRDKFGAEISGVDTYSEQGLKEAIELADSLGDEFKKQELVRKLQELYPTEENAFFIEDKLGEYKLSNAGDSSVSVVIGGRTRVISFEDVYVPGYEDYGVEVLVTKDGKSEGENGILGRKELTREMDYAVIGSKYIQLKTLEEDYAEFQSDVEGIYGRVKTTKIEEGESAQIGDYQIRVNKINLKKMAKVSVLPNIDNAGTTAQFPFKIGIEKRAIQLSPEQIKDRIERLNDTINNWEEKSEKLGTTVEGMQATCLATTAALTVKNFVSGSFGGMSSFARQETMDYIENDYCKERMLKESKIKNMQQCLEDEKTIDTINNLQKVNEEILKKNDKELEEIRKREGMTTGNFFTGREVDTEKYKKALGNKLGLGEENLDRVSVSDLKRYMYCQDLMNRKKTEEGLRDDVFDSCRDDMDLIDSNIKESKGEKKIIDGASDVFGIKPGEVGIAFDKEETDRYPYLGLKAKDLIKVDTENINPKAKVYAMNKDGKNYLYVLPDKPEGTGYYRLDSVYEVIDGRLSAPLVSESYPPAVFTPRGSYSTPLKAPLVKYFGVEPNKGQPAIVPFQFPGKEDNGYYVGVRNVWGGAFGKKSSYQDSGAAASFFICNAIDGRIDFNPEASKNFIGQDDCYGFSPGKTVNNEILGLSVSDSKKLANAAEKAIRDAQKGSSNGGSVSILGRDTGIDGDAAANIPQTSCDRFMSPRDCQILFNVCDPVICPASRCNLGGTYYVSDVIQSGIVGSIFLCFPNSMFFKGWKGGVAIPFCLTGIKAGIDALIDVYKSYRGCLIENLESGRTVGICDEIHSIHLCQFFWRQFAPVIDDIIPRLLTVVAGESVQGGGEYMNVQAAWNNAKSSMNYFTQTYAAASSQAFELRSTQEVGDEFCKGSLSGVFPELDAFRDLATPHYPAQFYGEFDETPFTTGTVPPTSQYSVFYHISAGQEIGAYYKIYLKSPGQTTFYRDLPFYYVDSGYIAKGDYVSEKKDFTSTSGYKEMCIMVNDQEECGFKHVSTSFAVNYVENKYLNNEAKKNISTERQCTSGTYNPYSFAMDVNPQGGAEEFLNPDIANRGIVRVCSSRNPGGETNLRWQEVGYCGDPGLKCWLDSDSVRDSIDVSSLEEDALNQVTQNNLNNILVDGGYMELGKYYEKVKEFEKEIERGKEKDVKKAVDRIDNILKDEVDERVYFDFQKAQLMLLRGRGWKKLTEIKSPGGSEKRNVKADEKGKKKEREKTGDGERDEDEEREKEKCTISEIKWVSDFEGDNRITIFREDFSKEGIFASVITNCPDETQGIIKIFENDGWFNDVLSESEVKFYIKDGKFVSKNLKKYFSNYAKNFGDGFGEPEFIFKITINGKTETSEDLKYYPGTANDYATTKSSVSDK